MAGQVLANIFFSLLDMPFPTKFIARHRLSQSTTVTNDMIRGERYISGGLISDFRIGLGGMFKKETYITNLPMKSTPVYYRPFIAIIFNR